jgi:exodeoxyribonuclease-1
LRKKANVLNALKVGSYSPVVHISGMFPALQGCASYVLPIAEHPFNKNAIIAIDLNKELNSLQTLSVAEIRHYLYTPTTDLPEGISRPAIKLIHINKCPIVAPAKTLTEERAEELGINGKQCRASLEFLKANPDLAEKCQKVFAEEPTPRKNSSPEEMLYTGGFFSNADKTLIDQISNSSWEELSERSFNFTDPRLPTLLWRYRARNAPQSLSMDEQEKWQRHCQAYLLDNSPAYIEKLDALALEHQSNPEKIALLKQLYNYLSFLNYCR